MQCQVEREAVTNWTEISAAESLAGLNMTRICICMLIFARYKYVIDFCANICYLQICLRFVSMLDLSWYLRYLISEVQIDC